MPPEREVQRTLCRCAKARGAVDMVYHPDRILTPLRRTVDGFEEIPLDQALDEIAAHVVDVTERYDARAVGVWKGEAVGSVSRRALPAGSRTHWGLRTTSPTIRCATSRAFFTHDDRFDPVSSFPLMKSVEVRVERA
jgi:hypothetical protein